MLANVSLNGYKFEIIKAPLTSLQAIWEVKDWICRRGESGINLPKTYLSLKLTKK